MNTANAQLIFFGKPHMTSSKNIWQKSQVFGKNLVCFICPRRAAKIFHSKWNGSGALHETLGYIKISVNVHVKSRICSFRKSDCYQLILWLGIYLTIQSNFLSFPDVLLVNNLVEQPNASVILDRDNTTCFTLNQHYNQTRVTFILLTSLPFLRVLVSNAADCAEFQKKCYVWNYPA